MGLFLQSFHLTTLYQLLERRQKFREVRRGDWWWVEEIWVNPKHWLCTRSSAGG